MKKHATVIILLLLTGCQAVKTKIESAPAIYPQIAAVITEDLAASWDDCSDVNIVAIDASNDVLEKLIRRTGRAVYLTRKKTSEIEYLNLLIAPIDKQGDATIVLGKLSHPSCTVSRKYLISGANLTPIIGTALLR